MLDFTELNEILALKAGEPDSFESGSQSEGKLKERSEGWSSAVANHARRSVGGGVLYYSNKLAISFYCISRATVLAQSSKFNLLCSKANKYGRENKKELKFRVKFLLTLTL